MTYVSCPNCGTTLTSGPGSEPPGTCPDCCATLSLDAALAGPPAFAPPPDLAPSFDGVVISGREAPAAARQAFALFCADLDGEVATLGSLLLSELVTNAVVHGSANGDSTIELHFAALGRTLQVEVSDAGSGFDPARQDSGWGLRLVEELAESWGVDEGRPSRVWFELPLVPAAVPSPI
jgi:hypothetical protein